MAAHHHPQPHESSYIESLVLSAGLTELPPHLPTLLNAFAGFTFVHLVVAPYLSKRWFPVAYGKRLKTRLAKNNWAIHVVSQVHTLLVVPLALWSIYNEPSVELSWRDKAFGWDEKTGFVYAIACGYFLWDTLDAIINFTDLGFVLHGIACFAIYTLAYRPFIAYYGTRCLLWETSTFFLNNHWFLDKTNRTGSKLQLINGILLLATFLGVRIIYGGYVSYCFVRSLLAVRGELPLHYIVIYGSGNVLLQTLNWIWFGKMISALRKRFQTPVQPTLMTNGEYLNEKHTNGVTMANGKH